MPAGCSATPMAAKIGVKPGHLVVLAAAPAGWAIEGLPEGVRLERRHHPDAAQDAAGAGADVIVAFFRDAATLRAALPAWSTAIVAGESLWAAWPRRAGGHRSDITDNLVRETALSLGLVDVKVAALDEDWSSLKLVRRRELRP